MTRRTLLGPILFLGNVADCTRSCSVEEYALQV